MTNILLNDNNRHRKYTGVDKFHAAGYYGERVKAASGESWNMKYDPEGQVHDPLGIADKSYSGTHAVYTCCTFFQVAPKTQLYMLESTGGKYYGNGSYENKFLSKSVDIIEKENITNMFTSLTTNNNTNWLNDMKKWLQDHPEFKQFWAAGNDDTDTFNPIMVIDEVFGVAAYTLMVSGEVVPAGYSSMSEYVDFSAPSMIYTYPEATKSTDSGCSHSGTSFSTPWLCGMACLVDDFFIDKTGKPLTQKGMYQFFKDNTTDLKDEGFDTKTGWGAVRLPELSQIVISDYAQGGGETPIIPDPVAPTPTPDPEPEIQFPAKYKVTATSLNVRETPNGHVLTTMKNGDIIYVHEISAGWAKFSFGYDNGEVIYYYYCSEDYIEYVEAVNSTPTPIPTPDPTPDPDPTPTEPEKDVLDDFSDKDDISFWATDAVRYCVGKGYIKGSSGKIKPKTNVTREELCVIIERICKE